MSTRQFPKTQNKRDATNQQFGQLGDLICLAAFVVTTAFPYVWQLGFYSDDWSILASLRALSAEPLDLAKLFGLFPSRPVQALYSLLMFRAFGLDPLGYHLVNTTVLSAAICLFYVVLRRLSFGRAEAFATAALFAILPQLSTIRVWFAASQVPLSMLLALVSIHAQISYHQRRAIRWLVLGVVAALASLLAYEIFAPLILFCFCVLAQKNGILRRRSLRSVWPILLLGGSVIGLILLFKIFASGRAGSLPSIDRYARGAYQLIRIDYDWRVDTGLNFLAAAKVHFLSPISGFARAGLEAISGQASILIVSSAAIAAAIFAWRIRSMSSLDLPNASARRLLMLGCAVFFLGHATFLIVPAIAFAPTGIGNRVLVAPAAGVAMILISLVSMSTNALFPKFSSTAFSIIMTVVMFCGACRIAAIDRFWADVPPLQRRILHDARIDLRAIPAGSTVILDGVCPYHGPAIVFETSWDIASALSLSLDRAVEGDVVSPRMTLESAGLRTSMYKQPVFYLFGATLFVYNAPAHVLQRLATRTDAKRYFSSRARPGMRCPAGAPPQGVPV